MKAKDYYIVINNQGEVHWVYYITQRTTRDPTRAMPPLRYSPQLVERVSRHALSWLLSVPTYLSFALIADYKSCLSYPEAGY